MTTPDEIQQMVDDLGFGWCINVSKSVTYNVIRIVQHLAEEGVAVTTENVLKCVKTDAKDDFLCDKVRLKDLVFTDERGEEIS